MGAPMTSPRQKRLSCTTLDGHRECPATGATSTSPDHSRECFPARILTLVLGSPGESPGRGNRLTLLSQSVSGEREGPPPLGRRRGVFVRAEAARRTRQ